MGLKQFQKFIKFYRRATTIYNVHAQVAYNFTKDVLESNLNHPSFEKIAAVKKKLSRNHSNIEVIDYGAGSAFHQPQTHTTVSRIATTAVSGTNKCALLYRIAKWTKASSVLELGTSLGIGTSYLSLAASEVTTIEGNPHIAKEAQKVWNELGIENIHIEIGRFDDVLPQIIQRQTAPDLVYIDGNHSYDATLRYFTNIKEWAGGRPIVFILDDIYWSDGMENAWQEIQSQAHLTFDLFTFGVVCCNFLPTQPMHYTLVTKRWKPWHIGFKPVR